MADDFLNKSDSKDVSQGNEPVAMVKIEKVKTSTLEDDPLNCIEEVKLWYELQIGLRRKLQLKIDDYVNGFTVHGLTKVFKGARFESLFWFCMLVSGISLCLVVLHGLISKYVKRAVYTEINSQITDKNYFPSITICEKQLLVDAYYAYCNKALRFQELKGSPCKHEQMVVKKNIELTNNSWSNGLFNVTLCKTWGQQKCSLNKFIKTVTKLNNSCITWNYNGDLYDSYSHTDIQFTFDPPSHLISLPQIIAIPHDPRIEEIDLTSKIDINPRRKYLIKLDKTIIRRLPAPYPSNCSDENSGNIFHGGYSRHACLESYNYINMFKMCGDTPDYVRRYIPKDIVTKYANETRSIAEMVACMTTFSRQESQDSQACRFPCEEWDLSTVSTIQNSDIPYPTNRTSYDITIQYQNIDTYKIMQEKELFTWNQMVCEIGGFIGIIIGMSVMSLIEVIVYAVLFIARKLI